MTPGHHDSRVHDVRLGRDITLARPDLGTFVLDRLGPGVWSEEVSLSDDEERRHADSRELKILPPQKIITDSKLKTPIFDETHNKRIIIII